MADKAKELSDVLCNRHNIGIYDEAEREAVASLIREVFRPLVEAAGKVAREYENTVAPDVFLRRQYRDRLSYELKQWPIQIYGGANEKRK